MALSQMFNRRGPDPARADQPAAQSLLAALDAARVGKDAQALAALVAEAAAEADLPAFELAAAGVRLAEAGFVDLARRLLTEATRRDAGCGMAHYETARLSIRDGLDADAADHLARAVQAAPHEFRYRYLWVRTLYGLGRLDEAERESALLKPRSPGERSRTEVLRSFGGYLRDIPADRAQSVVETVRDAYRWIDARGLAAEIQAAVSQRRPFALIRLGDGEGASAEIGPEDEARYAPLYRWMRESWVRFLFGPAFDAEATGYAALARTLMSVAAEADVLGVPYPTWIQHEYATSSLRGVPCTVNVHRWLLARPPASPPKLCDQIVHVVLHNEGLIAPILRRAGKLTVISCLTGLGDLIQQRFGLEEVRLLPVPREYTAPHLGTVGHVDGAAFPDVFEAMMARLAEPHEGRVFIIAAGTLGKFYAAQIKRHGGIALDLGSLVDGWMRLPSREGYGDQFAL